MRKFELEYGLFSLYFDSDLSEDQKKEQVLALAKIFRKKSDQKSLSKLKEDFPAYFGLNE